MYVIGVYYCIFCFKIKVCIIYGSTGTLKRLPLHCGLSVKIVYDVIFIILHYFILIDIYIYITEVYKTFLMVDYDVHYDVFFLHLKGHKKKINKTPENKQQLNFWKLGTINVGYVLSVMVYLF